MLTPSVVWRVSTWNQIYSTIYYIARKYIRGKTGWIPTKDTIGKRGKGGKLGMNKSEAVGNAAFLNGELGWGENTNCQRPKFQVYS
jgi:hypothetical protein